MPLALTVQPGYLVDDTKVLREIYGTMRVTGTGNYPVGGLPLDAVLLALPEMITNSGIVRCDATSSLGYVWTRVPGATPNTGKLMGLQVPPTGSLTTAAPLQQLPSTVDNLTLQNDTITFNAKVKRNA